MKVGDKVTSKPSAFTRVTGYVAAINPPNKYQVCASVAVYCGRCESVLIPQSDLIVIGAKA